RMLAVPSAEVVNGGVESGVEDCLAFVGKPSGVWPPDKTPPSRSDSCLRILNESGRPPRRGGRNIRSFVRTNDRFDITHDADYSMSVCRMKSARLDTPTFGKAMTS